VHGIKRVSIKNDEMKLKATIKQVHFLAVILIIG
jgi:hypothetical protein